MASKQSRLNNLEQQMKTHDCPLREQATQAVFGEGDPNADICFIGEAPGKNEDETGRPFVGRAGELLNDYLRDVGLHRTKVYIANIEKFRPPENRDPKPEEVEACFPTLIKQIDIIDPQIIVTLGRHALTHMLEWEKETPIKQLSMGKYHGKIINGKRRDVTYIPLYHPAAILYNRRLDPEMKAAFQKLRTLTEQEQ